MFSAACRWSEANQFRLPLRAANREAVATRIRELLDYIGEHIDEPITVPDAQAVTGLSRSHLHAAFRQATGTTFQQYLMRFRINEACRLLMHTEERILDIAFSCGFGSTSRFYEAFKRQTGTSPERYRFSEL